MDHDEALAITGDISNRIRADRSVLAISFIYRCLFPVTVQRKRIERGEEATS